MRDYSIKLLSSATVCPQWTLGRVHSVVIYCVLILLKRNVRFLVEPRTDTAFYVLDISLMSWFYSAPETPVLEAAFEGAHLVFELLGRTVALRCLQVHQNYIMPIPYEKVVFVDIPKLDSKLVQSPQSLLAALNVSWTSSSRTSHPLNDEANHAPGFAFSKMAEKLGANTAITDPLIGSGLNLNEGDFPGPNRKFDKYGFAAVEFWMR